MPFNIVPTPFLEWILRTTSSVNVEKAITELKKLRDVNCHLLAHFVAVQHQTSASAAILRTVVGEVDPSTTAPITIPGKK